MSEAATLAGMAESFDRLDEHINLDTQRYVYVSGGAIDILRRSWRSRHLCRAGRQMQADRREVWRKRHRSPPTPIWIARERRGDCPLR